MITRAFDAHNFILASVKSREGEQAHIVRKAGKKFKKSRKFNVLDLYEIDMGGPYAPSVPCTVHKNDFYSLVWL